MLTQGNEISNSARLVSSYAEDRWWISRGVDPELLAPSVGEVAFGETVTTELVTAPEE